ncbi:uncharacterized protein LOC115453245 isoform X5 [Manduca sexta]|uniref:uncharacterized protein LOC115453245 isoform X5 n=1 Tax=Manduca sexta TaxID=7130 RepID=UPI00188FB946|nr:uncharacterized protein LOC115453245 isoform X5 [Manduca sexta]
MKYIFFLLFLVARESDPTVPDGFQSSKCFKNVKKEKIISKKCPDVKCPPIDEPVCARVTSIKNNKTLYIIMVNKCEMEYMKCHQGLQASIVDMKNCGHEEYKTLKTLLRDKGRKRVKREAHSGKNIDPSRRRRRKRIARTDNKTIIEPEDSSGDIAVPLDATKEPITENGFKDISDSDEIANVKPEEPANPNEPSQEIETKNDLPEDLADDKILPDKEDLPKLNEVTDLPVPDMPVTDLPVPDMPVTNLPENMESGRVIVDAVIEPGKYNLENLPEELKKKKLTKDKKIIFTDKNQPDDYDIYQAECPMSCPTRDVMVCAKCQHNVYKTFMSICHMRMFSCMFTDEKLELVSRYPCVMSAPFLSVKPNTEPSGRITLADDEDKILKFIYCREKGNPTFMDGKNMILYSEKDNVFINPSNLKMTSQFPKELFKKLLLKNYINFRNKADNVAERINNKQINLDDIIKNISTSGIIDDLTDKLTDRVIDRLTRAMDNEKLEKEESLEQIEIILDPNKKVTHNIIINGRVY